jgi:hypothetical protein
MGLTPSERANRSMTPGTTASLVRPGDPRHVFAGLQDGDDATDGADTRRLIGEAMVPACLPPTGGRLDARADSGCGRLASADEAPICVIADRARAVPAHADEVIEEAQGLPSLATSSESHRCNSGTGYTTTVLIRTNGTRRWAVKVASRRGEIPMARAAWGARRARMIGAPRPRGLSERECRAGSEDPEWSSYWTRDTSASCRSARVFNTAARSNIRDRPARMYGSRPASASRFNHAVGSLVACASSSTRRYLVSMPTVSRASRDNPHHHSSVRLTCVRAACLRLCCSTFPTCWPSPFAR